MFLQQNIECQGRSQKQDKDVILRFLLESGFRFPSSVTLHKRRKPLPYILLKSGKLEIVLSASSEVPETGFLGSRKPVVKPVVEDGRSGLL